jgi:hypothetical protein
VRLQLNPVRWTLRTWIGLLYAPLLFAVWANLPGYWGGIAYVGGLLFVHKLQRALTPRFANSDWSPPAVD